MQHPGIVFVNLMSCLMISFPIRAIFLSEALHGCKKFLRAVSKTGVFYEQIYRQIWKGAGKGTEKSAKIG
ncbi:hypothetical protein EO92_01170 [Methanosarcina sp. 2.H.A.1B.4]|nr:hypothetical protein EO92_01170 [Methanosarcina sp. 2.H.A.1B.4]